MKQFVFDRVFRGMIVSWQNIHPYWEKNGNRQGAIFCELRRSFLNNCEFVTDVLTKREKKQRFLSLLHCTNYYCYRFLSDINQLMSFFNGVDLMGYTFLFACQVKFGIYLHEQ